MKTKGIHSLLSLLLVFTLILDPRIAAASQERTLFPSPSVLTSDTISNQAIVPTLLMFCFALDAHLRSGIFHWITSHWHVALSVVGLVATTLMPSGNRKQIGQMTRAQKAKSVLEEARQIFIQGFWGEAVGRLARIIRGDPLLDLISIEKIKSQLLTENDAEGSQEDIGLMQALDVIAVRDEAERLHDRLEKWLSVIRILGHEHERPVQLGFNLALVYASYSSREQEQALEILKWRVRQMADAATTDRNSGDPRKLDRFRHHGIDELHKAMTTVIAFVEDFRSLVSEENYRKLEGEEINLIAPLERTLGYESGQDTGLRLAIACMVENDYPSLLSLLDSPKGPSLMQYFADDLLNYPDLLDAFLQNYKEHSRLIERVLQAHFVEGMAPLISILGDRIYHQWEFNRYQQGDDYFKSGSALISWMTRTTNEPAWEAPDIKPWTFDLGPGESLSFKLLGTFFVQAGDEKWTFWPQEGGGWNWRSDSDKEMTEINSGLPQVKVWESPNSFRMSFTNNARVSIHAPEALGVSIRALPPWTNAPSNERIIQNNLTLLNRDADVRSKKLYVDSHGLILHDSIQPDHSAQILRVDHDTQGNIYVVPSWIILRNEKPVEEWLDGSWLHPNVPAAIVLHDVKISEEGKSPPHSTGGRQRIFQSFYDWISGVELNLSDEKKTWRNIFRDLRWDFGQAVVPMLLESTPWSLLAYRLSQTIPPSSPFYVLLPMILFAAFRLILWRYLHVLNPESARHLLKGRLSLAWKALRWEEARTPDINAINGWVIGVWTLVYLGTLVFPIGWLAALLCFGVIPNLPHAIFDLAPDINVTQARKHQKDVHYAFKDAWHLYRRNVPRPENFGQLGTFFTDSIAPSLDKLGFDPSFKELLLELGKSFWVQAQRAKAQSSSAREELVARLDDPDSNEEDLIKRLTDYADDYPHDLSVITHGLFIRRPVIQNECAVIFVSQLMRAIGMDGLKLSNGPAQNAAFWGFLDSAWHMLLTPPEEIKDLAVEELLAQAARHISDSFQNAARKRMNNAWKKWSELFEIMKPPRLMTEPAPINKFVGTSNAQALRSWFAESFGSWHILSEPNDLINEDPKKYHPEKDLHNAMLIIDSASWKIHHHPENVRDYLARHLENIAKTRPEFKALKLEEQIKLGDAWLLTIDETIVNALKRTSAAAGGQIIVAWDFTPHQWTVKVIDENPNPPSIKRSLELAGDQLDVTSQDINHPLHLNRVIGYQMTISKQFYAPASPARMPGEHALSTSG